MSLFGFGKRQSTVAAPPPPRPGNVHPSQPKIFPDELWEGETGKMLRAVGMSPDDESNFALTVESVDARIARDRVAHEARLADINHDVAVRTNGGSVKAFFLIPEPCWNGETGTFLLRRLQMFPYEDWNVAFLAADDRTAGILKLPMHPGDNVPVFAESSEQFLRARMAQMDAIREECDRTRDFGAFRRKQDDLKDLVRAYAGFVLEQYTGAWNRKGLS